MVRIWHFHCSGLSSIPGRETEILQVAWFGKKTNKQKKGIIIRVLTPRLLL